MGRPYESPLAIRRGGFQTRPTRHVHPGTCPGFRKSSSGLHSKSTAGFRSARNWCGRKERNPASARSRTIHAPGSSRSFRAALPPRARSPRCGGFRHFRHRPDRPLFTTPIFTSSPAKQARVGEMFLINLPASCGLAAHNMRANLSEFGPGNVRGGFQTRPYEPREDFRRGDPLGRPPSPHMLKEGGSPKNAKRF